MEANHNVRQTFALNKHYVLVHVRDVARGAACDCRCPACGESLVAKQGMIRDWHFAHGQGADCSGAVESSLHLAAKAILQRGSGLMVPKGKVTVMKQLADGRKFRGRSRYRAAWMDYDQAKAEETIGPVRPDITLVSGGQKVLVEIAVTHPVDEAKVGVLEQIGLPAMEIVLSLDHRGLWSWEDLEREVIEDVGNKRWLCPIDREAMLIEAEKQADEKARAAPVIETRPVRYRWHVQGMIVDAVERSWGICVWSSFHPDVTPTVSAICKQLGGSYKPSFRNWVVSRFFKDELFDMLERIADAPYQRVERT